MCPSSVQYIYLLAPYSGTIYLLPFFYLPACLQSCQPAPAASSTGAGACCLACPLHARELLPRSCRVAYTRGSVCPPGYLSKAPPITRPILGEWRLVICLLTEADIRCPHLQKHPLTPRPVSITGGEGYTTSHATVFTHQSFELRCTVHTPSSFRGMRRRGLTGNGSEGQTRPIAGSV